MGPTKGLYFQTKKPKNHRAGKHLLTLALTEEYMVLIIVLGLLLLPFTQVILFCFIIFFKRKKIGFLDFIPLFLLPKLDLPSRVNNS